ncbi:MAG TPA: wax ester/triacylglycerol synthase domain-containing protein [Frankiaceae bacterium]|nr:wax ester/triacylglycerol synthase domain-containing protein [Frankiaceae bacterium]
MADVEVPVQVTGPYPRGGWLRSIDAFTWRMEADPLLRSTVVTVLHLSRNPDWERLHARIGHMADRLPIMRERLVEPPVRLLPPRFELDPDFDLDYHLHRVRAASPGSLDVVLDMARAMGMARFDPARPMWEAVVVEDLADGTAATVIKLHHALADGIGGLQLALLMHDFTADAPVEPPDLSTLGFAGVDADTHPASPGLLPALTGAVREMAREVGTAGADVARAALSGLLHPLQATETAASVARAVAPISKTLSPVLTRRRLGWHYGVLEVPLEDLRAAAHASGATVNDAFLAAVTGALAEYHRRHGRTVPELRVTLPINVRSSGDDVGGNRIMLLRFPLPVDLPDPAERMRQIGLRVDRWRHERAVQLSDPIAGVLNLVPRMVIGEMLKHVDFLASNVPGSPVPLYLAGAEVLRQYPFGPTIGAALNVTLLSYRGTCCIGVTTDTGAVPDPDALLSCLRHGFTEIQNLGK